MKTKTSTYRFLLLQGISLIEDGLELINCVELEHTENTYDYFKILLDRFEMFKEVSLSDGKGDYMVTNAIEKKLTHIAGNIEQKDNIRKQLCQIRVEWIEDTE